MPWSSLFALELRHLISEGPQIARAHGVNDGEDDFREGAAELDARQLLPEDGGHGLRRVPKGAATKSAQDEMPVAGDL